MKTYLWGLLGLFSLFGIDHIPLLAQDVVVSEYYNGSDTQGRDEWSEWLIIKDNTDIRGWTFRDNTAASNSWQQATIFKNIPLWRNLRSGTIIVIWHRSTNSLGIPKSNPAIIDSISNDGYIEVSAEDTNYFNGGHFIFVSLNIAAGGDILQLRDAGGNHVHALGHRSTPGPDWVDLPLPKLNHTASVNSGSSISVCPGATLADYGTNAPQSGNMYTSNGSGGNPPTLGLANRCASSQNQTFWQSLREPKIVGQSATMDSTHSFSWIGATDPNPIDRSIGYLVLRGTTLGFLNPTDGITYSDGASLGSSIVLSTINNSTITSFTDFSINTTSGSNFYYRVYAFRYTSDDLHGSGYASERGRAYNTNQFVSVAPVPLSIHRFEINHNKKDRILELEWGIGTKSSKLTLQTSNNGLDFQDTKELDVSRQNERISYSNLKSTNYFRLKTIESDGSISFSKIIKINVDDEIPLLLVYPNPVSSKLFINNQADTSHKESIQVQDVNGRNWPVEYANGELDFSPLPAGIWLVSILIDNDIKHFRIVKN